MRAQFCQLFHGEKQFGLFHFGQTTKLEEPERNTDENTGVSRKTDPTH
jgi:hypothetical protein